MSVAALPTPATDAADGAERLRGEPVDAPSQEAAVERIAGLKRRLHGAIGAGDWPAAADLAAQVADLCPSDSMAQREASGYQLHVGDAERAKPYARRAAELAPDNAEVVLHYGVALNVAGDHLDAVRTLLSAAKLDDGIAETYQQLALAAERLGQPAIAAEAAHRACALEPRNEHRLLSAAHVLMRSDRLDEAIALLRAAGGAVASASVDRTLSAFLAQAGRHAEALAAIDVAIAAEPLRAEYHIHRSWLLAQLSRWSEAIASIGRAIELDPGDRRARRHAVTAHLGGGDVTGALRHGGQLLAMTPDDPETLSCIRHLIETQGTHVAEAEFASIAETKASAPPRPLRPPPTFAGALAAQRRSIGALVLRDVRSRYGESRIGFLWTLMEPFLHIGALAVVFQVTMHGRPPVGDSFFFFYFTGVLPYLLMSHLVMHVGHSVRDQRVLLQLRTVTPMDLALAKSIVEAFTSAVIFIAFLGLFALFGVPATPVSFGHVALAFGLTWMLGFGLGTLSAALFEFGAVAEHVVNLITRLLYFASGIFYVPANMPLRAREILVYNPLLHIVDAMRVGFFRSYSPEWMDLGYAAACSLASLAAGLAALRLMSRRMRSPS